LALTPRTTVADVTHLIQAIILLEHAQKSSTMNHYFRLLLIRIYRLLGESDSDDGSGRSAA
jgi:hypothetical protein